MPFKPTLGRIFIFSFSVASAAMLPIWMDIFLQRGTPLDAQFLANHHQLPYLDRLDYAAGALVLLALTLVLFVSMLAVRRFAPSWSRHLIMAITAVMLLHALNVVRTHYLPSASSASVRDLFAESPVLFSLALLLSCATIAIVIYRSQRSLVALAFLGAPVGIVVLFNVAASIAVLGRDGLVTDPQPLAPVVSPPAGKMRVVWLIFDEFDYRLAFEGRPAGFALPHLDRLRDSALFATHATSPGQGTFPSIPALTTGRKLAEAHIDADRVAMVQPVGQPRPVAWESLPSVFSDVRKGGTNVGILSQEYIPYCRIFHASASFCLEWGRPWPTRPLTTWEHAPDFFRRLLLYVPVANRAAFPEKFDPGLPYLNFQKAVLAAVTDTRQSLTFVHWMVPHAPYVYDRLSRTFTFAGETPSRYFDNMALADRFIGETVAALERSAELAARTVLIVSSDHSWRRSATYDGRRDSRVPFIVLRPGAGKGVTYSAPFNTIVTRRLIRALLDGRLESYGDMAAFIAQADKDAQAVQ